MNSNTAAFAVANAASGLSIQPPENSGIIIGDGQQSLNNVSFGSQCHF